MIKHYRRKPAIIVLSVAVALGGWVWRATANSASLAGQRTIEQLEIAIAASDATPATWLEYGEKLAGVKRYQHAATAFKKVLEAQPYNRQAEFACAMALAQAGESDAFYAYMRDLVLAEPKLSVEVFNRGECEGFLGEARFQALAKEARSQAMD